jgi:MFS transporter, ACS family, D-galactonate transporter
VQTRQVNKLSAGLVVACGSTQQLTFAAIALFLPLIREDIGLSFAQGGTLAMASIGTYALMQIPAGYLADRFGPKRVFVVGALGVNLLALAFSLLESYPLLLVTLGASGIFRAMVFAPGLLLMTAHFSSQRRATAMGLYVAGVFGSATILNALGPVLVEPLGWRRLFAIIASVAVVLVVTYGKVGEADAPRPEVAVGLGDLRAVVRHPVLWLCGVIQFVRLSIAQAFIFWTPSYLVDEKGFTLAVAGLIVAFGTMMIAPSNLVGGYVSDRLQRPLLLITVALGTLFVAIIALVNVTGVVAVLLTVGVLAFFVQIYFGPLFEVPIRHLGTRVAGVSNGFSNFWANVGGFTFAYTLGAVRDATGSFAIGFYALAALCLVGLGATAAVGRIPPARGEEVEPVPAQRLR